MDVVQGLFGHAQIAAPSKVDAMNPTGTLLHRLSLDHASSLWVADVNLIRALVSNTDLIERFAHQIELYRQLDRKPEDTLRRFSLNGDNRLDFKEFQPALKRLFGHAITHAQTKDLFVTFCPTSGKKLEIDQFCQIMGHWVVVADRMRAQQYTPTPVDDLLPPSTTSGNSVDNNVNIRRGLELATKHYDKLNEIFLKMDVGCTGVLTKEEFELAMSHLGVYLNMQEVERLYAQLPSTVLDDDGVHYAGFLSMLGVKMTSLFQNQKLWEKLLVHDHLLRKYINHYQKQGKATMSPDHFRDLLSHCGITLSNGDFTGLRLRMQEFQDVDGNIKLTEFLAALNDKAAFLAQSTALVGCTGPPSPIKRGKKKVDAHETACAAGKSTEQRNAEANTCRLKITDQPKKPNFADLYMQNTKPPSAIDGTLLPAITLEQRIWSKIDQFRDMGYTHCASLKGLFPGDRFGKITRGQFRQSVAQLSLVTRHAEVEALFWKLDPAGRGFISAKEFYSHLQAHREAVVPDMPLSNRPTTENPTLGGDRSLRVDEKKFFDALQDKIPDVVRACRALDTTSTGCVSKGDFVWVMQEVGLIMSHNDAANAIATLSTRKDGVVAYHTIADTLADVLGQSQLKSPRHLSSTSVLLDQTGLPPDDRHDLEPPKPKPQDYPARRSNLQLGYDYNDPTTPSCSQDNDARDLTYALQSNATMHHPLTEPEKLERVLRQRHARRVLLVQNILERRSVLKLCFDLMPYRASPTGLVLLSLDEIADILSCARMNIHLRTPDEANLFLREIVPPNVDQLSFVELIRILTMAQRMEPEPDDEMRVIRDTLGPTCCEVSIRAKLLQYSTLKDVSVMQWNTTGAIIVRHAFKGLSRDTIAVSATGSFDALCRNADLKHICYRLALDLTHNELAFLVAKLDTEKKGCFSSTALFQCFTQLLYAL
ncbi:Aste57867_17801 [Aphanomyces stellatus]|uniref:Aste57867_17801 protein n=1 Tax=Aphanomyces stellatus TaxID=120398 RepID=A0A485LA98_9STRA|nr:hypothetical protein As57867_017740 [Aphanomyces stellatus]VFT94545.1 Aste57867_17801 [Aphanomyces stellatus]